MNLALNFQREYFQVKKTFQSKDRPDEPVLALPLPVGLGFDFERGNSMMNRLLLRNTPHSIEITRPVILIGKFENLMRRAIQPWYQL